MDAEGDVKPWNKAELEKFHHFPASAFEAEELSEVAERQSDHSGARGIFLHSAMCAAYDQPFSSFSHLLYRLIFQLLPRFQMQLPLRSHVRQPVWLVLK